MPMQHRRKLSAVVAAVKQSCYLCLCLSWDVSDATAVQAQGLGRKVSMTTSGRTGSIVNSAPERNHRPQVQSTRQICNVGRWHIDRVLVLVLCPAAYISPLICSTRKCRLHSLRVHLQGSRILFFINP